MITIVTIIAFGLSVASLVVYFTSLWWVSIICLFGTILISSIGFRIERKIKTSGGFFINKIYYYFTRKDKKYNFESVKCTYICYDNEVYETKKQFEIRSNRNDLQEIDERFRWSASSANADIVPLEKGQSIKGKHQEEGWTCYQVEFGGICPKNKKFLTGSIIKNLHDPHARPDSFCSYVVARKTKVLVMDIEFPDNKKPKADATLKITFGDKQVGNPIPLSLDPNTNRFTKTIFFPRKGWRYSISWDE